MAAIEQEISSRQRILDTGARLFLERGYSDTTLRQIGSEVGIQAASIYYHFPAKDELLAEVLQRGIMAIDEALATAIDGLEGCAAFEAAVSAHLSALFGMGPYTAAHVTVFRRAPASVRKRIVPLRDAYEDRWDGLLRQLQDSGDLRRDLDLGLVRLTLLGSMNSALEWFDADGRHSIEELASVIKQQFWSGLAAQAEGSR